MLKVKAGVAVADGAGGGGAALAIGAVEVARLVWGRWQESVTVQGFNLRDGEQKVPFYRFRATQVRLG